MSEPPAVGARRAAADIAVQLIGRVGNLALGVVVTLTLARALGDRGFGQWATIFAITSVGSAFGDLGLETVAVARAAADRERAGQWIGAAVLVRSILAVPVAAATVLVLFFVADTTAMRVAGAVLSVTLAFGALTSTRAVFQLRMRNDVTIAVLTFNSVVWAAAVIVLAALHAGLVAFAVAFTLSQLASTSLQFLLAMRTGVLQFRETRGLWRELLRVAAPVSIAGLLVTAYVRIDQVIVFEVAGARQAGLYGAAYRILDQSQFVPSAVMTTLLPLMSAAWPANVERIRKLSQTAGELMAMASLGALAVAIALATPLMSLLFGHDFAAAGPALPILLGAFVCIAFGHLIGSLRIVLGLRRHFVTYAAVGLACNVVANLALVPPYGFKAAAWITLGTELLVLGLMGRDVLHTLEYRPRLVPFVRIAAAAAVVGGLAWLGRDMGAPTLVSAGASLIVYPALLFGSGAVRMADLRILRAGRPA